MNMTQTDEGKQTVGFSIDSLQMYSALINMGFDDNLSIKASQKFPKNAEEAINWIIEQTNTNTPQSFINDQSKHSAPTVAATQRSKPVSNNRQKPQLQPVLDQDLKAWVIQNNLSQNITNALKQNDVESLEDLKLLEPEDIHEFANDLGLKIIAKRKFIAAVNMLKTHNNSQQYSNITEPGQLNNNNTAFNQNYNNNPHGQVYANPHNRYQPNNYNVNPHGQVYANPHKQPNNNYHPYGNPYANNNANANEALPVYFDDDDDDKEELNAADIKKQERKQRTAHLKGDIKVSYSLNKRSLDSSKNNRCILVIGATGTGKTTCLNSMMNYLWNVEYDDNFRYKLIMENSKADQTKSQTKDVTAYYLNPPALDYSLTLVDTPGYGDTDGLTEDDKITKRIRHFFDTKIQSIDAVCFVIRAPQARLNKAQQYVFTKVLDVFGKDIKDNIFILLTFADGYPPPALAAIKKANIPYKKAFKLNNAGFFLHKGNINDDDDDGLIDFDDTDTDWNRGMRAFDRFFSELNKVKAKSLTLTRKVLSRRERLQNYVCAIQPTINKAYSILEEMRIQIYEVNRNATIIDKSKDYDYFVDVSKTKQVAVSDGVFTTTCTNCVGQFTCHKDCVYGDNADKAGCCAMDQSSGNCTVCPNNCHWNCHKNLPYLIEFYTVKEKRTTKALRRRYVNAQSAQSASDQIIAGLTGDLVKEESKLQDLIGNVRKCINELRKIALQPNIMSKDDYIDQLIESEKLKREKGWQSRVKTLQELKKKDQILMDVASNNFQGQFENYNDVNQYLQQKNHRQNIPRGQNTPQRRQRSKAKKKTGIMRMLFGV